MMTAAQGSRAFDVLTFGETMLRLTPPGFERFQQANVVETHVGGSESNTAVGLSRLGCRVAWYSRLTNNPLGQKIAQAIAAQGVNVDSVCWTDQDRVGTYYMERGAPPRGSQVYYDRANSAMANIEKDDFPMDLIDPARVRILHSTGITPGISKKAEELTRHVISTATERGLRVSFDVNYRAKLWSPHRAAEVCRELASSASIVFLPQRDATLLFGIDCINLQDALLKLHELWPAATIVMTRGAQGACAISPTGEFCQQAAFSANEVERLGGGDAFSAGFLWATLTEKPLPEALLWATATAALKYTIPGDLPLIDKSMVERLVHASSGRDPSAQDPPVSSLDR